MTRSSEVVMRLNGCDATDGMFDLVFSRPQGHILVITATHAAHRQRALTHPAMLSVMVCVYMCGV